MEVINKTKIRMTDKQREVDELTMFTTSRTVAEVNDYIDYCKQQFKPEEITRLIHFYLFLNGEIEL